VAEIEKLFLKLITATCRNFLYLLSD